MQPARQVRSVNQVLGAPAGHATRQPSRRATDKFSLELRDKHLTDLPFGALVFIINTELHVVSSPLEAAGIDQFHGPIPLADLYDPRTRLMHPRFHNVLRNLWDLAPSCGVPRIVVAPLYAMTLVRLETVGELDLAVLTVEAMRSRATLHLAASRFSLTRREIQILELILDGSSGPQIAALLNLAESTIQTYFKKLLEKTGSANRYGMVAKILGWQRPTS